MSEANRQQPLVAVITPVYNGAAFLQDALACVQAQTYPNLIHIVLDNASTDATPELIAKAQGGCVPILARRNAALLRQIDNWNAAVGLCPPEAAYFRLLCADDTMPPDAIEKMVVLAETDPEIGLVGCLQAVGSEEAKPERIDGQGLPPHIPVYDGPWLVKTYLMRLHAGLSPTHMLIRCRFLETEKPFFRKGQVSFDVQACLRLLQGCKYGFVQEVLGWTRVHEGSTTARVSVPNQTYIAEWLAWIDSLGPRVMTPAELAQCRRAHLRHYYRRLLLWRYKDRDRTLFDRHISLLAGRSVHPSLRDYAGALAEWVWLLILNQREQVGAARALRDAAWIELTAATTRQESPGNSRKPRSVAEVMG